MNSGEGLHKRQQLAARYGLQAACEKKLAQVLNGPERGPGMGAARERTGHLNSEQPGAKVLLVTPRVGIGALKLGMSPEQILVAIAQEEAALQLSDAVYRQFDRSARTLQIAEALEGHGMTRRYMKGPFFFMVHYQNEQAVAISVDRQISHWSQVTVFDMDVFHTPVETLIHALKQFGSCTYDNEDEQLSSEYEFRDMGLRLWREMAFHEKLLLDEAYMDEMRLVIDDMYRYLYFDMVTVKL